MPLPYVPASPSHIKNQLHEAQYYIEAAIQALEEYLPRDLYEYVADVDVALVSTAMAYDARVAEEVLTFIKAQILDWLNSR
jgi:hypothetical protein